MFNGGYLQVAYTLTGENRAYDKKYGTLSRYYFGGQGPYENAFLVRDADGNLCSGQGAWEIAGPLLVYRSERRLGGRPSSTAASWKASAWA